MIFAAGWPLMAWSNHKGTALGYASTLLLCSLLSMLHPVGGVLLLLAFLSQEFVAPDLPGFVITMESLGHHDCATVEPVNPKSA